MNNSSERDDELMINRADSAQTVEADYIEDIGRQEQAATWNSVQDELFTWLSADEIDQLNSRWNLIQIGFVDNPHTSVEKAGALVEETLERIGKSLSDKCLILDGQGHQDEKISTEDLRIALQSYRSLFSCLLRI